MMKRVKEHSTLFITCISFIVMIIISLMIILWFFNDKKETAIEKARYLAKSQVSELDRSLSSYMQATNTLRLLIVDSHGKINNFDEVASQLYKNDKAFRSIQLAPQGNVQYVYPLAGNEEAFGDLFDDPDRQKEAEYARDSGKTTLAGPFELYQSGLGIVIRQPIYLEENQQKVFWGFSIVVLNVPEIFNSVHLDDFTHVGYEYKLWRIHPDTQEKQIIMESSSKDLIDPVETKFDVPGSQWTLSISLKHGWINYLESMPIIISMICVSLLIPALIYAVLKINEQRRKMVEISYQDYLTELYNGRKMSLILSKNIKESKPFLLIYLDVDKFKQVNDTYGHLVGDQLLKGIASRIKQFLHEKDYGFRIGGDEFVIVLYDRDDPLSTIESLEQLLTQTVQLEEFTYHPQVSIGYSKYPDDASSIEDLVKKADEQMYHHKKLDE